MADIQEKELIVDFTPNAILEVKRLLAQETRPNLGLRLGVKGGGCSGLSYVVEFGEKKENDHQNTFEGFQVFVDPKSSLYLKDTRLDYKGGINGKGFVFENPNASNTCGCGESFSV